MWEQVLNWVLPFLTGGVGMAIITGVVGAISKNGVSKLMRKVEQNINEERIASKTADKVIAHIQSTTIKHSIQPAVESELERVNEKSAERFEKIEKKIDAKFNQVIAIQEKQADYFADSLVSDTKKQALAEEIEKAKLDQAKEILPVDSQIIVEQPKVSKKTENSTKIVR